MKIVGIDPSTKGLNMQMVEVTEHGLRMLEPPTHILYSGPLRNGHGTIQVSRRRMPPGYYWNKVDEMVRQIASNLGIPDYMVSSGPRLDVFDLARRAQRVMPLRERLELQGNVLPEIAYPTTIVPPSDEEK